METEVRIKKIADLNFLGTIPCPCCGSQVTQHALVNGNAKRLEQITVVWTYKKVLLSIALMLCVGGGIGGTAFAVPITYSFTGTLADGGNLTGQWQYDPSASPLSATATQQVWAVSVSAFTLNPLMFNLPVQDATVSSFCTGSCLFGGTPTPLLFAQGSVSTLRLAFSPDMTSLVLNASWLKSYNADGSMNSLIMVNGGTVVENSSPVSTGEPSYGPVLALAMAGLAMVGWWRNKEGKSI